MVWHKGLKVSTPPMKTGILFLAGALVAIAVAVLYSQCRVTRISDTQEVATLPPQTSHATSQPGALNESHVTAEAPHHLRGPAAKAVRYMVAKNPGLGLKPEEIGWLEAVFAKHYTAFMEERNQMVTVQATGPGAFEIMIPSWPAKGSEMLNAFLAELQQSGVSDKHALLPAAKQMFEGYTEEAGRNGVTYKIEFKEDSDTLVKYTRRVAMLDPVTHQVTGTGFTEGELDLRHADPVLMAAIEAAKEQ